MTLEILTAQVCHVAREAGAYLRAEQHRLRAEQVERKHAHDYVSYVDKTSEQMIVERLGALLPRAGFVTEEGTTGNRSPREGQEEALWWVVDPLDGTTNYVHGASPFAVSIALRSDREVLVGVVYEVSLDECFSAWKGGGAWLNGHPIHVGTKPVTEALLGIELPYNAEAYRSLGLDLIGRYYGLCGGIRMNGSAAVSLCWVACGRWDGWLERHLGPWDFMAGGLIVGEAGGLVTDFRGQPHYLDGNEILVGNAEIHAHLIESVRFFDKKS